MRESPSRLLWRACGSHSTPKAVDLPRDADGDWRLCRICAGSCDGRGIPVAEWDGAAALGVKARYPRGQAVCEPCLWIMARHTKFPGKTGNTRNYSWLLASGESPLVASKGEKPSMLAWLRRPHKAPWFAAIADSGQKHVVPFAPLNGGSGTPRIIFEEAIIELPKHISGWFIVDDLAALLTAGATKEEVERGEYAGALSRCEDEVRAFEARYAHLRGSAWFALVVFLAQRDEAAVAERLVREAAERAAKKEREKAAAKAAKGVKRGAKRSDEGSAVGCDSGRGDGTATAVPRRGSERAQALGPDHRPDARGDAHDSGPGGVVHEALPRPADSGPVQRSLFELGEPSGDGAAKPRRSTRVARSR